MNKRQFEDINKLNWIYAKSMPKYPHYYIIRNIENEALYISLFREIEKYGVVEYFYRIPRKYLYLGDGYKYWHMCSDKNGNLYPDWFNVSKIINRSRV